MKLFKLYAPSAFSCALAFTTVGCSDDESENDTCSSEETDGAAGGAAVMCAAPSSPKNSIEIVGTYDDGFGTSVTITEDAIQQVSDFGESNFQLSLVNNADGYALALNDEENGFFPCSWSAFYWVFEGDDLYVCQGVFDASSECGAEEADAPDSNDLAEGCSGFSWSKYTPAE